MENVDTRTWCCTGSRVPRSEIVYLCQVLLILSIVLVGIYNLTNQQGDQQLWLALLCSCMGYLLPNHSMKSWVISISLCHPTTPWNTIHKTLWHNLQVGCPNAINLSGDWEVGLVEIQYPHNWFIVPTLKKHSTFTVQSTATTDANGPLIRHSFYIRTGYYPHIYDLLTEIQEKTNEALSDVNNSILLNYGGITRKISVTFSRPCSLSLPMHIWKMIGLMRGSWDATNSNDGDVSDLDPVDSLFVYCDVLEHRVVGDSQVP